MVIELLVVVMLLDGIELFCNVLIADMNMVSSISVVINLQGKGSFNLKDVSGILIVQFLY
jgi:hypothetical protein